jgi:hypothetical protein
MNHVSLRHVEQIQGKLANVVEKLLIHSMDITQLLRMVRVYSSSQSNAKLGSSISAYAYKQLYKYQASSINLFLFQNKFVKLVGIIPVDSVKNVLSVYNTKHPDAQGDNILISTLMHLSTMLHDSVE